MEGGRRENEGYVVVGGRERGRGEREGGGERVDMLEEVGVGEREVGGSVDEEGGGGSEVGRGVEEGEDVVCDGERGGFWWKREGGVEVVEGFGGGVVVVFRIY